MKPLFLSLLVSMFIFAPLASAETHEGPLTPFIPPNLVLPYDEVLSQYQDALEVIGVPEGRAEEEMQSIVNGMGSAQSDVSNAYEALESRVDALLKNDNRTDRAKNALKKAGNRADDFTGMRSRNSLVLQPAIAGALPRVIPSADFSIAEEAAEAALNEVNRVLLAPNRPGMVPEGDLLGDFLPQLIRQFFRFAWLAVLISFVVSGVFLVTVRDNDEQVTKAKGMIYYSMVGFAVVSLAFAIVKAVSDIDFFRFI